MSVNAGEEVMKMLKVNAKCIIIGVFILSLLAILDVQDAFLSKMFLNI